MTARALVLVAVLSLAPAARADAVPPPPADCPPGARGETGHNGPWCMPTTCTTDADCARYTPARACRPQALCVEAREEKSQSGWSSGSPITRVFAHATCDDGAACAQGTCASASRCVATSATPEPSPPPVATTAAPVTASSPPAPATSGGCAGGGAGPLGLALAALLTRRAQRARGSR